MLPFTQIEGTVRCQAVLQHSMRCSLVACLVHRRWSGTCALRYLNLCPRPSLCTPVRNGDSMSQRNKGLRWEKDPVKKCVTKAITEVLKKARRRQWIREKRKPEPRYTQSMHEQATGSLAVHRLVRQALSKVKILASARKQMAAVDKAIKKKRGQEYYMRHRDEFLRKCAARRQSPQFKKMLHDRLLNDPEFLVSSRLRRRLHTALAPVKTEKKARTMELVGCSWAHLVDHLSSQLEEGVNLNSKVIDHIFPMSMYSLQSEDQQRRCMHYSNLQPLDRIENAVKHNSLPSLDVALRVNRDCWPDGINEDDLV